MNFIKILYLVFTIYVITYLIRLFKKGKSE